MSQALLPDNIMTWHYGTYHKSFVKAKYYIDYDLYIDTANTD